MSFSEVTLGEISIGNKGSYGVAASAVEYSEDLYTYLRITDINDDGTLNKNGLKSVDDENATKHLLKPNDIVFARTGGSTGRSYFYDGTDGVFVYAGFLIKFSLDPTKVNPKYLRYYTLSDEYKGWVNSFNTGSTRGNINAQTYANMKLRLPDGDQQKLLVDTLSCLDNMIELNNRTNQVLEEVAKALFKHWFVDFEFPNEDGQPYKSSGGEMVNSELGEMPNGWRVSSLADIIDVRDGTHDSPKPIEDGFTLVTSKHLMPYGVNFKDTYSISEADYLKINQRSVVEPYDILISMIGTVGNISYIMYDKIKFAIKNIGLFKTSLRRDLSEFILLYLKSDFVTKHIYSRLAGNTQKYISLTELRNFPIILPGDKRLIAFKSLTEPLFKHIKYNENQSVAVLSIRDTLLPKLMSGEIRVPIEEVV